jgi:hypothetical protein
MTKPVSLAQQIEEVPHEVKFGFARAHFCGVPIALEGRMKAVLATLRWLQANEATIKAALINASKHTPRRHATLNRTAWMAWLVLRKRPQQAFARAKSA